MSYVIDEELEFERKNQVKPVVQECIFELLERFWILREEDEQLFFKIKDNEPEIKKYFRDTFRYRLVSNHKLIKLEKVPVEPKGWMGEKYIDSTSVFRKQQDYVFFFFILAYLEGKNDEQQFTLQDICDYLQVQENGELVWKDGRGYQNRLSLVRVMKYIVKNDLIRVVDQDLDDFTSNSEHDVLLQRTPYSSHFIRLFKDDVTEWENLNDFMDYLYKENHEFIDRKHRFYRRLFLEATVDHSEITEDEWDYVKNYYTGVENNIYRYTDMTFERYKYVSLLVKERYSKTERIFPSDNIVDKLILSFTAFIFQNQIAYPVNSKNQIELNRIEMDNVISQLKSQHRKNWTKSFRQAKVEQIREEIVAEMKRWNFIVVKNDMYYLKEALFRIIGQFNGEEV